MGLLYRKSTGTSAVGQQLRQDFTRTKKNAGLWYALPRYRSMTVGARRCFALANGGNSFSGERRCSRRYCTF